MGEVTEGRSDGWEGRKVVGGRGGCGMGRWWERKEWRSGEEEVVRLSVRKYILMNSLDHGGLLQVVRGNITEYMIIYM